MEEFRTDSHGGGRGAMMSSGEYPKIDHGCGSDVIELISEEAWRKRFPLCGSFAVTHRCNLSCRHCYIPLAERKASGAAYQELSTDQVKQLFQCLADEGCLHLLITGGEPLTRRDFIELWIHAKSQGLLLTLFTNGTLVTPEIVDVLKEWPPLVIEVTLYGATPKTYEVVTGSAGALQATLKGIEMLLNAQLNVKLKSLVTTQNRHELQAIERIADRYGVKFRMDACVFSRLDGDQAPLSLRLNAREAVEDEFSCDERAADWERFYRQQEGLPSMLPEDSLYDCGAGIMSFHLDAFGALFPCVMVRTVKADAAQLGFGHAWQQVSGEMSRKKAPLGWTCKLCNLKSLCGYCPGFFEMEKKSETIISPYLCKLGECRQKMILERTKPKERNKHERREVAKAKVTV